MTALQSASLQWRSCAAGWGCATRRSTQRSMRICRSRKPATVAGRHMPPVRRLRTAPRRAPSSQGSGRTRLPAHAAPTAGAMLGIFDRHGYLIRTVPQRVAEASARALLTAPDHPGSAGRTQSSAGLYRRHTRAAVGSRLRRWSVPSSTRHPPPPKGIGRCFGCRCISIVRQCVVFSSSVGDMPSSPPTPRVFDHSHLHRIRFGAVSIAAGCCACRGIVASAAGRRRYLEAVARRSTCRRAPCNASWPGRRRLRRAADSARASWRRTTCWARACDGHIAQLPGTPSPPPSPLLPALASGAPAGSGSTVNRARTKPQLQLAPSGARHAVRGCPGLLHPFVL